MNGEPTSKPLPEKAAQIARDARAALARRVGCETLPVWPTGQTVEIAPGVRVVPMASFEYSEQVRILIFELEPQGNGMYRPVARARGKRVRLTREGLPQLGIAASYMTLRRLIAAGFVRGEQPAPGVIQMDLDSYFEHERATADPEFWTRHNHANLKKLRLGVAGTYLGCGGDYKHRKRAAAPDASNGQSAVLTPKSPADAP